MNDAHRRHWADISPTPNEILFGWKNRLISNPVVVTLGFQVLKYLCRVMTMESVPNKGGLADMKKARDNLNLMIAIAEEEANEIANSIQQC